MLLKNVLSARDTKAIADFVAVPYVDTPVLTEVDGADFHWVAFIVSTAVREAEYAGVTVEFVPGQPYATADEMRARVKAEKVLYISADNNADVLLPGVLNLIFRAAHDLHHCRGEHCNFVLDGEICAFAKFAEYALEQDRKYVKPYLSILFQEIVAQTCFLRHYGSFPAGTIYATDFFDVYIEKVLTAYGL